MIQAPVITALNTSTYTPIVVPKSSLKGGGHPRPMTYYTEDGSSFLQAVDDAGTGEAIIPAGAIFTEASISDKNESNIPDGIIFYAKATAGTPNLVVKIGATCG